jgi:hypothetical protein
MNTNFSPRFFKLMNLMGIPCLHVHPKMPVSAILEDFLFVSD